MVSKTFLGSMGILGIKIAQHLSTSPSFGLSDKFKEILGELTENAEGLDKGTIFSMLEELGEGDVEIDKIGKSASIKTTFSVKNESDLYKIKNLNVFYEAQKDIKRLEAILDDLENSGIVTKKQAKEILDEMQRLVDDETNFDLERENAKKLKANYEKRKDKPAKDGHIFTRIFPRLARAFGDLSAYKIGFSRIKSIKDNMLIKEERVIGRSLNDYGGDDKEKIYNVVILELMRQVFRRRVLPRRSASGKHFCKG